MSVVEMKEIMKQRIDRIPEAEVEKVFSRLISTIDFGDGNKIDLHKHAPGIFEKYDALMKKLA